MDLRKYPLPFFTEDSSFPFHTRARPLTQASAHPSSSAKCPSSQRAAGLTPVYLGLCRTHHAAPRLSRSLSFMGTFRHFPLFFLLKWNLHNIKLSILKGETQWHLAPSQCRTTTNDIYFQIFSEPPKGNCNSITKENEWTNYKMGSGSE